MHSRTSFFLARLLLLALNVNSFRPVALGGVGRRTRRLHATVPKEGEAPDTKPQSIVNRDPDMEAFASGYTTVFEELPFKLCSPSVGSIPNDLEGSYYRAGPSMFSAGSIVPPKASIVQPKQPPVPDGKDPDRMVLHPFEGDGAVLGVTFTEEGEVAARFRYVRTVAFTNERKKGRRIYQSMDSTRQLGPSAAAGLGNDHPLPLFRHHLQPGLNKNRKNTSNTRTVYWGKRLLSLWEGGQPTKVDSLAVSTEGRSQLGGAIKKEADPFGSKMVYDPKLNRALFYGVEPDAKKSVLTLYEFDSDFRLAKEKDGRINVHLDGFAMVNDFCATENYAIFVQPNVVANGMQFVMSKEPGKSLSLEKGLATVTLVPRVGSSKRMVRLQIPSDGDDLTEANLQFVNAYEDGDSVVMDVIRSDGSSNRGNSAPKWPWATSLEEYRAMASKKSLWRYTIDLQSKTINKQCIYDTHCFFGVINPSRSTQKHRYIYMNVGSTGESVAPPQGIAKLEVETGSADVWLPEPHQFCGEPMFAPRAGDSSNREDDGYILSLMYDGKKKESELLILDASVVGAGPVTRLPLGIAIPHGLFGCFTNAPEAKWSAEKIERRSKLADKVESKGNRWNEVKSDFSGLGLRFDDMEEYFGDFFS